MSKSEEKKEERQLSESAINLYNSRLSMLKKGRAFMSKNDIPKAVKFYQQYLEALSNYYGVTEKELNPKHFKDQDNATSEMLLVSHVYWDLARSYDLTKNLQSESLRCLNQFVKFTVGFKYQHVNAQMLKKYMKRKKIQNYDAFKEAYNEIYVKPKGCYIATACYGPEHEKLITLRHIRDRLTLTKTGKSFVWTYYHFSPRAIHFINTRSYFIKAIILFFSRAAINLFLIVMTKVFKYARH